MEPLPTEPGIYEDKDGGLWRLYDNGLLKDVSEEPGEDLNGDPAKYAPFTRLVPESEKTALVAEVERLRMAIAKALEIWGGTAPSLRPRSMNRMRDALQEAQAR